MPFFVPNVDIEIENANKLSWAGINIVDSTIENILVFSDDAPMQISVSIEKVAFNDISDDKFGERKIVFSVQSFE